MDYEDKNNKNEIVNNDKNDSNSCTLLLTCKFCHSKFQTLENVSENKTFSSLIKEGQQKSFLRQQKTDDGSCPSCKQKLTKCAVCLFPISIDTNIKLRRIGSSSYLNKESNNKDENEKNVFNECYVFCTKCLHGGHLEHYKDWFNAFNECPFFKCSCKCEEN